MGSLRVSDDVAFEVLEGEAILLNLATGTYYALNHTGTRFWELLEQLGDPDQVRDAMLKEYEVPRESLAADLIRLIQELTEKGLLVQTG